jgi:hypothetical protein
MLKHWLLQFALASQELPQAVAYFMDWLSNNLPSWGVYIANIAGRLLTLDNKKSWGVRPAGVTETRDWRNLEMTALC